MHRHLLLFTGTNRITLTAERALPDVGHRLSHDIELTGVLDPVELVAGAVDITPFRAQLDLRRGPSSGVTVVELLDIHRGRLSPTRAVVDPVVEGESDRR